MNGQHLYLSGFWIKTLLLSSTLLIALTITSPILAAKHTKSPAEAQTEAQQAAKSTSPLQVQNYKGKGLDIEFRYVKGKLKNMRVMNTTKYTIKVDILDNRYILGPGDYVVIDPPSVDLIQVRQSKLFGDATAVDNLFPERFTYYITFKLPAHHEKKITTSE
jgi:hypothetical protein